MTQQEIVKEFSDYSTAQQAALINKLSHVMQEKLESGDKKDEEKALAERLMAIERLRGIGAVEGKTAPTDEEIKEDRVKYLMEKYY